MDLMTQTAQIPIPKTSKHLESENERDFSLMKEIHRQMSRRSFAEIRSSIQERLAARACTAYELQSAIHTSQFTIKRHLNWLEKIGAIYSKEFEHRNRKVKIWFAASK